MIEKCARKKIKKDLQHANQIDAKKCDTKECLSNELNYFQDKIHGLE